jgi:hypothetical protein
MRRHRIQTRVDNRSSNLALIQHPTGHYRFLPGIAPYSCGVVSIPGREIAHVTLHAPVRYENGFEVIDNHLAAEGMPRAALCGIELRSPRPFTFPGFSEFNARYARILESWELFVDGINPVARTNVAPEKNPPAEPVLYGFSYSRPCDASLPPTFVIAGAGELPEGLLTAEAIVRRGDTTPDGIAAKSRFVMDLMESRLLGLGGDWSLVTAIDIYTIHSIDTVLPAIILDRAGPAAVHGVRWFHSRPPIEEIEFELDLRGVRAELRMP